MFQNWRDLTFSKPKFEMDLLVIGKYDCYNGGVSNGAVKYKPQKVRKEKRC
jgi:hypothetical protein